MSNYLEISIQLVQKALKEQHGIDASFQDCYGTDFFPKAELIANSDNRFTVLYNKKAEILLSLYNIALLDSNNTAQAISHYVLFNTFIELFDLDNAEKHLRTFQNELSKINIGNVENKEERMTTQCLFTLLHEAYHILFRHNPSLKAQAIETEAGRMKDIQTELSDSLNLISFEEIMSHPKIISHIKSQIPPSLEAEEQQAMQAEMLKAMKENFIRPEDYNQLTSGESDSFLEELACDRLAWLYVQELLKMSETPIDEICQTHIWGYIALNAMQFDWVLNTLYRKQKHDRVYNPKAVVIRQKSYKTLVRHYLGNIDQDFFSHKYSQIADNIEKVLQESATFMFNYQKQFTILYSKEEKDFVDMNRHDVLKAEMSKIVQAYFENV